MLDIDEIRAHIPGDLRSHNVILDELLDFAVGPDLVVAGDFEFLVKNGMPIADARLHPEFVIWFAETPRVSELETDDQIVRAAVTVLVSSDQSLTQPRQPRFVFGVNDQ